MAKSKTLHYFRIVAAVILLWLGLQYIGNVYFKYAFFALLLFVMEVDVVGELGKKLSFKKGFVSVMLFVGLSILISRVFPVSGGFSLTLEGILSAIVFAPICEELFFRKAMNDRVPDIIGALLSSAVFGIFHGVNAFLPTFIAGLGLFVIYRLTGSLKASIAAHMTNNALAVLTHPETVGFFRELIR